MIKNELYNKLTGRQKTILNRAMEGNLFEECNLNDVMLNVQLAEIDDKVTSENPYCIDFEIYEDIRRFINSQINDFDARKHGMLMEGKKQYSEEQEYIEQAICEEKLKAEDILFNALKKKDNIIKHLDIDYVFTGYSVQLIKI